MRKKIYEKPTCKVVMLRHKSRLLNSSPTSTPPNDVHDYDDWLE